MERLLLDKVKSDCFNCRVYVDRIWQCYKLYDGDNCPSYSHKDKSKDSSRDEILGTIDDCEYN